MDSPKWTVGRALAYWSVGQRLFRYLIVTFVVRYVPLLVDTLALQGSKGTHGPAVTASDETDS